MQDFSLHILDVAENGIRAGADLIQITVEEDLKQDRLLIEIEDNGRGMASDFLAQVLDPFVTTRTTRSVGLGLSLLQQSAQEADGDLKVESDLGKGTLVRVEMSHSHIDRRPLGNMAETILTLIEGNPDTDFAYKQSRDDREYLLDTRDIRIELEEIPLNTPEVVGLIRENLVTGLSDLEPDHR